LVDIFPTNIIAPLLNSTMLQVIVIALFLGAGILLAGEKGEIVAKVNEGFYAVFMKIMEFIIALSPIGVFCMMAWVVANQGAEIIGSLALVLLVAYLAYLVHMFVVYSFTVSVLGKMNPIQFFKGMLPAMIFAFSSTSSVATLPITIECSEKLGAKKDIASFVLPLGATINMDGTAIYMGVTTIFIATCYGIELSLAQMVSIILTATLASIGTAGVSGAGVVMLAMVLESVSIPVAGIALIIGIDRLFDMGRTTLNILGDASCAIVLSKLEDRKNK
ncbi:MAG: dicarboxylate/amino acid:cation symporter, partial [Oscillospiraceae bacterium]|nr:dicarboxylate/amino acid:cation symporter [Oscillospiraceae bacterium]